jgi:hypothetical protein
MLPSYLNDDTRFRMQTLLYPFDISLRYNLSFSANHMVPIEVLLFKIRSTLRPSAFSLPQKQSQVAFRSCSSIGRRWIRVKDKAPQGQTPGPSEQSIISILNHQQSLALAIDNGRFNISSSMPVRWPRQPFLFFLPFLLTRPSVTSAGCASPG